MSPYLLCKSRRLPSAEPGDSLLNAGRGACKVNRQIFMVSSVLLWGGIGIRGDVRKILPGNRLRQQSHRAKGAKRVSFDALINFGMLIQFRYMLFQIERNLTPTSVRCVILNFLWKAGKPVVLIRFAVVLEVVRPILPCGPIRIFTGP